MLSVSMLKRAKSGQRNHRPLRKEPDGSATPPEEYSPRTQLPRSKHWRIRQARNAEKWLCSLRVILVIALLVALLRLTPPEPCADILTQGMGARRHGETGGSLEVNKMGLWRFTHFEGRGEQVGSMQGCLYLQNRITLFGAVLYTQD